MDAVLSTIFILGGFILLENVFGFYSPQRSNFFLILFLPLFLSFLITSLSYYISIFLIGSENYQIFLSQSYVLRLAFVFILFLAFTIIVIMYRRLEDQLISQKREESVQKMSREAELYHLRSQLQPHFLFNSLNSINALVASKPDKAREMIFQLSDFLRGTIRKEAAQWVSFEEEIHILKLYLDIEKVRFGHRLNVEVNSSPDLISYSLPSLLLQPLVENAVKYGLYGTVGEVTISLDAIAKSESLLVIIRNPFDPIDTPPKGSGYGLSAVQRRLYLLFGRNDLVHTANDNNVFTVTLTIPQFR